MSALLRTTSFLAIFLVSLHAIIAAWGAPTGDLKNGKARYEQYCAICHGATGLGDGPMAKATMPPAPRLSSPDVRKMSDEALLAVIADGKGSSMPAWRGLLTEQELNDVPAYLRSLGG